MYKILIDCGHLSAGSQNKDGIYRYIEEIVLHIKELASHYNNLQIDLFSHGKIISIQDYREDIFTSLSKKKVDLNRYDLIHITTVTDFKYFIGYENRVVATFYDLTVTLFPEFHHQTNILRTRYGILYASIHADHIISISDSTKRDFLNLYKYPDKDVSTIHLAYNASIFYQEKDESIIETTKEKYNIDSPYILSLSTLEPRKNLSSLLKAFNQFNNENPGKDLKLVLVGRKGWKYKELFENVEDKVIFTGFVPDEDLSALYSGALFFCYISFYEGFGLPVLEAMACGTPVIYGDNSSMPEIAGDAGIAVEVTDIDDIHNKMKTLYFDKELCQDLSRKSLKRAEEFSWDRCSRETLDLYLDILNNNAVKSKKDNFQEDIYHLLQYQGTTGIMKSIINRLIALSNFMTKLFIYAKSKYLK